MPPSLAGCPQASPQPPRPGLGTDEPVPVSLQRQGDSGGPLICDGVLQGVDSFVIRACATRQFPDFFARVSLYVDWIRSVLRRAGPRTAVGATWL